MQPSDEILQVFAAMTPRAQERLLVLARKYAKEWPAPKKQGLLRLVQSDMNTKLFSNGFNSKINLPPPICIRKAIDK